MLTWFMWEPFEAVVGKPSTITQNTTPPSLSKDQEVGLTVRQSFADHTPARHRVRTVRTGGEGGTPPPPSGTTGRGRRSAESIDIVPGIRAVCR